MEDDDGRSAEAAEPVASERQGSASHLNEIGVLKRREIEARIVAPLLQALGREFGRERVLDMAAAVIEGAAREQGEELAVAVGGRTLVHFAKSWEAWARDGALQIDILERTEDRLSFNVTRCRYAEMYRALGVSELGALLSCNRDFALVQGFNREVTLRRTQTIMDGYAFCDFRYLRER